MNERIRELYNQSLEEKYQYGGSDAKPGEMYSNYITVLNPEKFAELIVRECASKADSILRMNQVEYIATGGGTMGDVILEHFGVDE